MTHCFHYFNNLYFEDFRDEVCEPCTAVETENNQQTEIMFRKY